MVKLFLIPLFSASTVIFPTKFISFLFKSWYFPVIGKMILSFLISSFDGVIVIKVPKSTTNCFCVPSKFPCHVNMFSSVGYVFYFSCFYWLVGIAFLGLFKFYEFFIFFLFSVFKSASFCEFPLLFTDMACWFLDREFVVRVPIWCVAISAISFFFRSGSVFSCVFRVVYRLFFDYSCLFDISASGLAFFVLFLLVVFCYIHSTTYGTSKSLSFNSLSRSSLSMIDGINCDTSNLVLKSRKLHPFSRSINFFQWCSGVAVSVCFAPNKSPRELYLFFFRQVVSVLCFP